MLSVPPTPSKPVVSLVGLPWRRWGREAGFVFLGGIDRLLPRLWIILAAVALGMGAVLIFSPQDNALLAHIRVPDATGTDNVAKFLSKWGDLNGAGPLAILIWIIGAATNRIRWRKLGLALLMGCLVSGLILNIFRVGTGRPRPYYQHEHPEVADKFYGPQPWKGYMQSFPSGHACAERRRRSGRHRLWHPPPYLCRRRRERSRWWRWPDHP